MSISPSLPCPFSARSALNNRYSFIHLVLASYYAVGERHFSFPFLSTVHSPSESAPRTHACPSDNPLHGGAIAPSDLPATRYPIPDCSSPNPSQLQSDNLTLARLWHPLLITEGSVTSTDISFNRSAPVPSVHRHRHRHRGQPKFSLSEARAAPAVLFQVASLLILPLCGLRRAFAPLSRMSKSILISSSTQDIGLARPSTRVLVYMPSQASLKRAHRTSDHVLCLLFLLLLFISASSACGSLGASLLVTTVTTVGNLLDDSPPTPSVAPTPTLTLAPTYFLDNRSVPLSFDFPPWPIRISQAGGVRHSIPFYHLGSPQENLHDHKR